MLTTNVTLQALKFYIRYNLVLPKKKKKNLPPK